MVLLILDYDICDLHDMLLVPRIDDFEKVGFWNKYLLVLTSQLYVLVIIWYYWLWCGNKSNLTIILHLILNGI